MSAPRLDIDWTRCDGHGLCARLWPDRVEMDPWGFPILPGELAESEIGQARRTVGVCPNLALRLQTGGRRD